MSKTSKTKSTGYTPCACRDCFETAIGLAGVALCHDCETAGCDGGECQSPTAYGQGDEPE